MIGVGNFHINTSNVWSFFSAAAKNGGYAVDVINACLKAGLDAAKDRDNVREAIDKELAKWTVAPGDRSAVVEIAWRVVDVLEDHLEDARAQMMTILFVNNTPFNTYTSAQPEYQQLYTPHGDVRYVPGGVMSPKTLSALTGSIYMFTNKPSMAVGPAGAFWVQMQNPSDGRVIGGLNVAYWDPYSGTNGVALSFNQGLKTWFDSFPSSGSQQLTATAGMTVTAPDDAAIPNLVANIGLNSLEGSVITACLCLGQ